MSDTFQEPIIDYSPADKPAGRLRIWIAFIVTWAMMGIGYIGFDQLAKSSADNNRLVQAIEELKSLEKQNSALKTQLANNTQTLRRLNKSVNTIDELQQVVNELPSKISIPEDKNKANKSDVTELSNFVKTVENRIASIEQSSNNDEIFDSVTFTLLKVRDRVSQGLSYKIELDLLKKLTSNDTEMKANLISLETALTQQNSNLPTLREDFSALVNKIANATKTQPITNAEGDDSFFGSISSTFSDTVKVTKIDTKTVDENKKIVGAVQRALRVGDVNLAIQKSGNFTGSAAAVVKPWRNKLKALNKSEQLFEKLYAQTQKQVQSSTESNHITPAAGKNTKSRVKFAPQKEVETSIIDALDAELSK